MEATPYQTFDTQLDAVRQKPREKLRATDIRRLLKLAGKRPTDAHIAQIASLITQPSPCPTLVFELLGELTLNPDSNSHLLQLKPDLAAVTIRWLSAPPPPSQDMPQAIEWLRLQLETLPDQPTMDNERARFVLLWLADQHRSPEFFLQCLRRVGTLMNVRTKKPSKRPFPKKVERASGFVMSKLAKSVIALGRGPHPKFGKLAEITTAIDTTLEHVHERAAAAEDALRKQAETEGALAEQERLARQQDETIRALEQANNKLEARANELTQEVERLGRAHQMAIDHTNAQVAEGKRALLTEIRSKLDPKLTDAKLYLDRPSPVVPQVLRLIGEITEALKSKETHQ